MRQSPGRSPGYRGRLKEANSHPSAHPLECPVLVAMLALDPRVRTWKARSIVLWGPHLALP